jgi:hypothetical protein
MLAHERIAAFGLVPFLEGISAERKVIKVGFENQPS